MNDDEAQDETMNCGLGVIERDLLQRELRRLPETMPPRVVWQRIEQQARAEGLIRDKWQSGKLQLLAGGAIAATVALLVLNIPSNVPPTKVVPEGTQVADSSNGIIAVRDLNALKVESRQLERSLRLLPAEPRVMKVSTATTIRDLEDRITAIDIRLNDRSASLDAEQEETYWRERVRLMNSLVRLRYAQAQRIAF